MSKKRSLSSSFYYAFEGIKEAFKNEPNFRIHSILGLIALSLAYILNFKKEEWIILFFTIAFVLILELINTSLEAIVDLVSPNIRAKAKVAKDVSAAAVFISSILALLVGAILFLPKIINL